MLAVKWRVFTLLAVVFARQVVRLDRAGSREALARAERLEICIRCALVGIHQDIANNEPALSAPTCEAAAADLTCVATCLLAMAMMLAGIRERLEAELNDRVVAVPVPRRARSIGLGCFYEKVPIADSS